MPDKKICDKCSGRGIIFNHEDVIDPNGELKICPHVEKLCRCGGASPYQYFDKKREHQWCACRPYRQKLKKAKRYLRDADIPKKYRYKFLDDFKTPNVEYKQFKEFVKSKVENFPKNGIYFWGKPGTGKTLMSCIILNELILRFTVPGKFLDLSYSYFQKIRSTFDEESIIHGQSLRIMETYVNVPILIIDDFGVQRGTEWENEMLFNLIDKRYEEQRFTIVTSNRDLKEFQDLSEGRIYSRFQEMLYPLKCDSPDYRPKYEKAKHNDPPRRP